MQLNSPLKNAFRNAERKGMEKFYWANNRCGKNNGDNVEFKVKVFTVTRDKDQRINNFL